LGPRGIKGLGATGCRNPLLERVWGKTYWGLPKEEAIWGGNWVKEGIYFIWQGGTCVILPWVFPKGREFTLLRNMRVSGV